MSSNYTNLQGIVSKSKLIGRYDGTFIAEALITVEVSEHGPYFTLPIVTNSWKPETLLKWEGKKGTFSGRLTVVENKITLFVDWISEPEPVVVEEPAVEESEGGK